MFSVSLNFMLKETICIIPEPLGSIPSLPANSCKEIKANEGGQAVSGNSWLDVTGSGEVVLAYCDMNTEGLKTFLLTSLLKE